MPVPSDADYMREALALARDAAARGEVPVGALIVRGGEVLGTGANRPIHSHDPTAHAEIEALRSAGRRVGDYRLNDCTLYVTLEPCPMCAGAILQARPERVVYGAPEPVSGAAGSVIDVFRDPRLPTRIPVEGGVLAVEAADALRAFFAERRG